MHDNDQYDRVIDQHQLRAMVLFHPTHIARLEALGEFPRRIKLGRARVGWSLFEVLLWLEARKAERDAK
jgi:predicted DNA-binding transcriptional regulator AlpA